MGLGVTVLWFKVGAATFRRLFQGSGSTCFTYVFLCLLEGGAFRWGKSESVLTLETIEGSGRRTRLSCVGLVVLGVLPVES